MDGPVRVNGSGHVPAVDRTGSGGRDVIEAVGAARLRQDELVEHLPLAVDREDLIGTGRRRVDLEPRGDRGIRRGVGADLREVLLGQLRLVGPSDRIEVGITEERPTQLVDQPVSDRDNA